MKTWARWMSLAPPIVNLPGGFSTSFHHEQCIVMMLCQDTHVSQGMNASYKIMGQSDESRGGMSIFTFISIFTTLQTSGSQPGSRYSYIVYSYIVNIFFFKYSMPLKAKKENCCKYQSKRHSKWCHWENVTLHHCTLFFWNIMCVRSRAVTLIHGDWDNIFWVGPICFSGFRTGVRGKV